MFLKGLTARSTGRLKVNFDNFSKETKASSKPVMKQNLIQLVIHVICGHTYTHTHTYCYWQKTYSTGFKSQANYLNGISTFILHHYLFDNVHKNGGKILHAHAHTYTHLHKLTCFHDITPWLIVILNQGASSQHQAEPRYQTMLAIIINQLLKFTLNLTWAK